MVMIMFGKSSASEPFLTGRGIAKFGERGRQFLRKVNWSNIRIFDNAITAG